MLVFKSATCYFILSEIRASEKSHLTRGLVEKQVAEIGYDSAEEHYQDVLDVVVKS